MCFFSVIVVLKLAEIERLLAQKGRFEYISVQVAVSLTWFIRRLASNYLGFDEHSYENGQIPDSHWRCSISRFQSVKRWRLLSAREVKCSIC